MFRIGDTVRIKGAWNHSKCFTVTDTYTDAVGDHCVQIDGDPLLHKGSIFVHASILDVLQCRLDEI